MQALANRATRLLRCKTPIILPPMAGAGGGLLAARVSLAGGFGFIPAGYGSIDSFRSELSLAKSTILDAEPSGDPPGFGVGLMGWQLDHPNENSSVPRQALRHALESRVASIWLSFGSSLGDWVRYIRSHDKDVVITVLVNSVDEAIQAVNEWKVDLLVAQGIESGGHGGAYAPPLLSLVPGILTALPNGPPVLAAGGLATGSHLASMLALGAEGVVYGTRFLLTDESFYNHVQKQALLEASSTSTVRTKIFDEVRGTTSWPDGVDGRALRNMTIEEAGVYSLEERKERFQNAIRQNDKDRILVWAGTGVGLMKSVKPAADVVRDLQEEALSRIQAVGTHIT
ncbi:2-nitropropane dioxygenase [Sistotremastrum suecicum HHB10207 ss-3]|uniref:2-nitropropane dioxygenase n=1 Tax=Sistotremastrum suecicum HHB10207 ss-3 TaxID=1314776 RepID=A0A166A2M2_9AGAM|nr:2-nitropropane dioxygenase [Sistotremastrum suecicum HHB10207 ss-3]